MQTTSVIKALNQLKCKTSTTLDKDISAIQPRRHRDHPLDPPWAASRLPFAGLRVDEEVARMIHVHEDPRRRKHAQPSETIHRGEAGYPPASSGLEVVPTREKLRFAHRDEISEVSSSSSTAPRPTP
ncbi:hypothetical protein KM043_005903 [Ampulex compressa]|nr:hypothetical protein KM043_005903 [Ampulex compressa]